MVEEIKIERLTDCNPYTFELLQKSFPEVNWSKNNLDDFLLNTSNILIVAQKENIVAGLIRAHILPLYDSKGVEILLHEIDVIPAFQRQGIAFKLIEKLKKVGNYLNASEIWVLTNDSNKAAMGLYEKTGMIRQNKDDVMFNIDL